MQYDTLSKHFDRKLKGLDQQLANLQAAHQQLDDPDAQDVVNHDIKTLLETRSKLIKSHTLAAQAHQLQQETDPGARYAPYRRLGLALMAFSAFAMAGLIAAFFWLH